MKAKAIKTQTQNMNKGYHIKNIRQAPLKSLVASVSACLGLFFGVALAANATSTFITQQGGTGTTSPSGILYGDNGGTSHLNTVIVGSGLTFSGGTLAASGGSGITALGPTGQTQTGPTVTLASSTNGTDFTITGTGNILTFNLPTASASNRGLLSSTDWSTFNSKQSALTFSTGLTNTAGTVTVNSSQNIATLSNLTSNGAVLTSGGVGTLGIYTGTSCTNQFVRSLSGSISATCATVGASDVSLANLSATDSTLTFSGTYNGSTARTIGVNQSAAFNWTGLHTFTNASTSLSSHTGTAYFGATATTTINADGKGSIVVPSTGNITATGLGTAAGTFVAADPNGKLIATTSPSGGGTSVVPYVATASGDSYLQIPVISGDTVQVWGQAQDTNAETCSGVNNESDNILKQSTMAASTTKFIIAMNTGGLAVGCTWTGNYQFTATTTETLTIRQALVAGKFNFSQIMAQKIH